MFSLELPHHGDFNEYTQYIIINLNTETHPNLSQIRYLDIPTSADMFCLLGTRERIRNTRGK